MYKKGIVILFSLFFSYAFSECSSARAQNQDIVPATESGEAQTGPVVSKQVSKVEIKDNLLSVELVNAVFGDVLNDIALKSGFKVEINGDVSSKKLTTKFNGIELERGIIRLMSLINEKNYMFYYDTKGALSGMDVYGGTSAPAVKAQSHVPVRPPVQRQTRILPVSTPTPVVQKPVKIPPVPTPAPVVQKPAKIPPAPTPPPAVQKPEIMPPASFPASTPAEQKPGVVQKNPPQSVRRLLSPLGAKQMETQKALQVPAAAPVPVPTQPQQNVEPAEPEEQGNIEENVEEIPYVPAPRNPTYIPPKTQ